ncbi:pickpocket protein 28-like [Uranotaenia lowii]|uniref:pickpocket protein 28-like n=1 Tax=Uranotaenia lowii TaxID=190385 RepID=UPI0024791931|nr:pickpocket protein 28-like [Uranotaenia lowii]
MEPQTTNSQESLFQEYCSNSSIHGVRYFASRRRKSCCGRSCWVERALWIAFFALSVGGCGWLILKVYRKWDNSPVIVTFAERQTPVWQIPFPAITICPQVKVPVAVFNFSAYFSYEALRGDDNFTMFNRSDYFFTMLQLCETEFYAGSIMFRENYSFPNTGINRSMVHIMEEMAPKINELLVMCKLRSIYSDCYQFVAQTVTEEGICYTYNGLSDPELFRMGNLHTDHSYSKESRSSSNWSLEKGYGKCLRNQTYPFRSVGSGVSAGIDIGLLTNLSNLEYLCRGPLQSFKLLLHSPDDYPLMSKKYIRIPIDQDVMIAVKPQMITTASSLHDYTPERRQCFFNHERTLQFFQIYTQDNCELECLTNYTRIACGCVKFSMPRGTETEVCDIDKLWCIRRAEISLMEMRMEDQRYYCNCLPACTSIQYSVEITQTDLDLQSWMESYEPGSTGNPGISLANVKVYFKEAQFITSKRSELYGVIDFLANCGGLLGLCLGVSVLSLVEIVYFCTARPIMQLMGRFRANKLEKEHVNSA